MTNLLLMVFIMAFITYFLRALPIVLIRKEIKSPFLRAFLNYVPFAILGALTVPDIFYCTDDIPAAIAGTIVALIMACFGRGLLTVAVSAVITVLTCGLLF